MGKLSKSVIRKKADEWAKKRRQISKLESARNEELDPLIREFEKATKPIYDQHDPKIMKLRKAAGEIEEEILAWLGSQGKVVELEGELAVAANEKKVGSRVIDVRRFLDFLHSKGGAIYDCITVGVAAAEKLLGKKTVDNISTKESRLVPTLRLK